ncbi:acyl carrier protein [Trichlorobacter lovleyi]|uniref:acyl carrier protein n=1 Tax=Trichlorobacter lovleyi TaxID=313985 RepID=UPI002240E335|nr:acyl carrier protein [Trichlorobacter lovleyi]QOX79419.1 acyl carrier protein [Trichlorobacter lovleyi]
MNREQACAEVTAILHELLPGSGPAYQAQQHLQRDLGIDSIRFVQLVLALEDRLAIAIDDADLFRLRSVGDCVDLVMERLPHVGDERGV